MMFDGLDQNTPVTIFIAGCMVATTAACVFNLTSPLSLYFSAPLILQGQVWRLITHFFYISRSFSISFAFQLLMILRYARELEERNFRNKPADFAYLLLLCFSFMTAIAVLTSQAFMSGAFKAFLVYVWSRRHGHGEVLLMGLFSFRAVFLPFLTLIFALIDGSGEQDIIGMFLGHCYIFFADHVPKMTGSYPLRCPDILCRLVGQTPSAPMDPHHSLHVRLDDEEQCVKITGAGPTIRVEIEQKRAVPLSATNTNTSEAPNDSSATELFATEAVDITASSNADVSVSASASQETLMKDATEATKLLEPSLELSAHPLSAPTAFSLYMDEEPGEAISSQGTSEIDASETSQPESKCMDITTVYASEPVSDSSFSSHLTRDEMRLRRLASFGSLGSPSLTGQQSLTLNSLSVQDSIPSKSPTLQLIASAAIESEEVSENQPQILQRTASTVLSTSMLRSPSEAGPSVFYHTKSSLETTGDDSAPVLGRIATTSLSNRLYVSQSGVNSAFTNNSNTISGESSSIKSSDSLPPLSLHSLYSKSSIDKKQKEEEK